MTQLAEQKRETVRRYLLDVWGNWDFEAVNEVIADDFVDHNAAPGLSPDREGHHQFLALCQNAFPELHVTVEDVIVEGDKVAYRWKARGSHEGEFMGVPATDKEVTITGSDIVRIKDGKIAEAWHIEDNLGLMQQLGVIPSPGENEQ